MLWEMVEHPAAWRLSAWSALIAAADEANAAAAAVAAGADAVDLSGAPEAQIAEFRMAHPAVPVCLHLGARRPSAGSSTPAGTWLIFADLQSARRAAEQAGLARERLLVLASPAEIRHLATAGWQVIVDVARHGGPEQAGMVAAAALSCWLGAAAVLTSHPGPVRQALDMTASIAGRRPPARAIRGLA